jgi:hypothetical protein
MMYYDVEGSLARGAGASGPVRPGCWCHGGGGVLVEFELGRCDEMAGVGFRLDHCCA